MTSHQQQEPRRISLNEQAHQCLLPHLTAGAIVIDATVGNGHDTLFLARQVSPTGSVYGFDIQAQAISATQARLAQAALLEHCHLFLCSHEHLAEQIPLAYHGQISAIMFNLGYLPRAKKNIITRSESTLTALNAAIKLLAPQGMLTILVYPGHTGGDSESKAVANWAKQLDPSHYDLNHFDSQKPSPTAPKLFVIRKLHSL